MKLTNKGRYAVMAMADLASNANQGPISLTEISLRQNISVRLIGPWLAFEARSAIAITAYLPLEVSFIN